MTMNEIVHYAILVFLALVTLIGAIRVMSTRSIVHAAFWLFPVLAGVAGFYLLLSAQFLAAVQVLIYIGAIMVLFVFAVTLTRDANDTDAPQTNRFVIPTVLAAVFMALAVGAAVLLTPWQIVQGSIDKVLLVPAAGVAVTDVPALGIVLFQQYLLPFEIASVLLLAAIVGAIVLARKEREPAPAELPALEVEAEEAREPVSVG